MIMNPVERRERASATNELFIGTFSEVEQIFLELLSKCLRLALWQSSGGSLRPEA